MAHQCNKHGFQGIFIGVQIDFGDSTIYNIPKSLQRFNNRKYCMTCLMELYDRELEPLVEVKTNS